MAEQLNKADYIKLSPLFTQPLKIEETFYATYIQKALWNIAIDIEKVSDPSVQQKEHTLLRVMYLLETLLVAQDYLVENRFPMVVPVLKPKSTHKIVDVVYTIEQDNEKKCLYLGCSNFCVLETADRLNYTLREL